MCIGNTQDPRAAVIGFYGVRPGFQGRGIGVKVWREVVEYLGPERNVALYSSPAEIDTYKKKAGFAVEDGVQLVVYESHGSTINKIAPTADDTLHIQVLPTGDFMDDIVAFDETLIGVNRGKLLRLSLKEPQTVSFVAVNPSTKAVLGYGAMRATNYPDERALLAPLYATSYSVAQVLLYNLMINYPASLEKGFFSFLLSSSDDAKRLAEAAGLTANFGAPRLFTREPVSGVDESRIFAIISPDYALY